MSNKQIPPSPDHLWDEHSEHIGSDIDDLQEFAGTSMMKRSGFIEAVDKLNECKDRELNVLRSILTDARSNVQAAIDLSNNEEWTKSNQDILDKIDQYFYDFKYHRKGQKSKADIVAIHSMENIAHRINSTEKKAATPEFIPCGTEEIHCKCKSALECGYWHGLSVPLKIMLKHKTENAESEGARLINAWSAGEEIEDHIIREQVEFAAWCSSSGWKYDVKKNMWNKKQWDNSIRSVYPIKLLVIYERQKKDQSSDGNDKK